MGVTDERGKFLGTALYSSASQIAIRLISSHAVNDLGRLLRERIQEAINYRERVVRDSDAYRVIFSEADFLPGLIVDRYNDLVSIQALTQAMDGEPVRSVIAAELRDRLKPAAIAERVDPRIRELEQLPARPSGLIEGEKTSTVFTMNGVRFHYQALEDRRPDRSSTSAKITRRPRALLTGKRWMFSVTRAALPCTCPSAAQRSQAWTAPAPHLRWPTAMRH